MPHDDDPIEFTGRDRKVKADPVLVRSEEQPDRLHSGLVAPVAPDPLQQAVANDTFLPEAVGPGHEPDDTFLDDVVAEPASIYPMNVYDNLGKVRRDLDPSEISKCTDRQKTILFGMLASLEIAEKSESVHYEAVKATRRATTAIDKSRKAYETALPKRTFHDEWRETVAKLPATPITDEKKAAIAAALIEVEKAETHLAACQSAEITAKRDEKDKRAAFAKSAIAWSAIDGIPKNVGDLVKARGATERKIALANIAAGRPHDYGVGGQAVSTVGPSHLDRFKAAQAKGGSANFGYNRNAMRGAVVKPPSAR